MHSENMAVVVSYVYYRTECPFRITGYSSDYVGDGSSRLLLVVTPDDLQWHIVDVQDPHGVYPGDEGVDDAAEELGNSIDIFSTTFRPFECYIFYLYDRSQREPDTVDLSGFYHAIVAPPAFLYSKLFSRLSERISLASSKEGGLKMPEISTHTRI